MNEERDREVRAVTFDAAGTLIHLREGVGQTYARLAEGFGLKPDADEVEAAFRFVWKSTPDPYSPGSEAPRSQKEWWKTLVRAVFARCSGCESFAVSEDFDVYFERLFGYFAEPGVWQLDPEARRLLDHLADRRLSLAVVSNFDQRLPVILRALGILDVFDRVVISEDLRISKPDRRIFDHTLALLGCPAEKAWHVGDDPVCDGDGAGAAGMRFLLVGPGRGSLGELIGMIG